MDPCGEPFCILPAHPENVPHRSHEDPVDEAIEATRPLVADLTLSGNRRVKIEVPHPFSPDDFESVIVALLHMRAASEQRTEQEAPVIVPKGPMLVSTSGQPIAGGRRA
jgi:hypothetical protein